MRLAIVTWFIVLFSALLAVPGCAGDQEAPSMLGEIIAGSADLAGEGFVPVADGTSVELVPGSQGGFHVWLNVSIHGVSGQLVIDRQARRAADEVLVYRGQRQDIEVPAAAMDDFWDHPHATPAFMCPSPIGIRVFDEELIFEVRLLDENDELLARDELVLVPRCPEGDLTAFCHQICSG